MLLVMAQLELPMSTFPLVSAASQALKGSFHSSLPLVLTPADHSSESAETASETSAGSNESTSSSSPSTSSSELEVITEPRDVHQLPTYSSSPSEPILYLPPLLSALPQGYTHDARIALPRTLATESRLPTIDEASLALHKALHHFRTLTRDYATVPYNAAFNWDELVLDIPLEEEREWYCVAFRSKRKEGSDGGRKYSLHFHTVSHFQEQDDIIIFMRS